MHSEEAKFLATVLVPQIENEHAVTRKVIGSIPVDKVDYQPDSKSWQTLDLAWHIAAVECTFLEAVALGKFIFWNDARPAKVSSPEDVLTWYVERFSRDLEIVKALPPEGLSNPIAFYDMFTQPAVMYLQLLLCHSVHHRGYLYAYLRPMGIEPPIIYGNGPDEPAHPWTPAQRDTSLRSTRA